MSSIKRIGLGGVVVAGLVILVAAKGVDSPSADSGNAVLGAQLPSALSVPVEIIEVGESPSVQQVLVTP